jgi:hypothetical protein
MIGRVWEHFAPAALNLARRKGRPIPTETIAWQSGRWEIVGTLNYAHMEEVKKARSMGSQFADTTLTT